MAHELSKRIRDVTLCLSAYSGAGCILLKGLAAKIQEIEKKEIPLGSLDICSLQG